MLKKFIKVTLTIPIVAGLLVAFVALGMVMLMNIGRHNSGAVLLGLVVILPVSIAVHELGHLLAAWSQGLRVTLFAAWPVLVVRSANGLRVKFEWRPSRVLGRVIALPTDMRRARPRMLVFIAGGPFATFLLMMTCVALAAAQAPPPAIPHEKTFAEIWSPPPRSWETALTPAEQAVLTSWPTLAALLNAVLLLGALNPDESIMPTDGAQLIDWIAGGRDLDRSMLMLGVVASSRAGVRARDWDAASVERALARPDGSRDDLSAHMLGYYQSVDRGEVERAGQLLDYVLERLDKYPAALRPAVALEGAYFEGFFRRDAAKARQWFKSPGINRMEEQTRLRAEAAVLFAEGDLQTAVAKAEAGLAVVMNSEDPGGAISERDWLIAILDECRRGAPASPLNEPPP